MNSLIFPSTCEIIQNFEKLGILLCEGKVNEEILGFYTPHNSKELEIQVSY